MSGRGVAALSTNQKIDPVVFPPPAPPFDLNSAENGTSVHTVSRRIILGQPFGAAGNPAALLFDTEIPLAGRRLAIFDTAAGMAAEFFGQSFSIIAPDPGVSCVSTVSAASAGFLATSTGEGQLNFAVGVLTGWLAGGIALHPGSSPADPGTGNILVDFQRMGLGVVPTAYVHTRAGLASAGNAPWKYTAGVAAQTVLENGAKNYNGTNEFLTVGGVNYTMAKTLTATANLDFPNTAAQLSADLTIALTGAADGDVVCLGVPIAAQVADTCYTAFVSAANTVTVRFNNYSAGAVNPAAGVFRVSIIKY